MGALPLVTLLVVVAAAAGLLILRANWYRFSRIARWLIVLSGIVIAGCTAYVGVFLWAIWYINRVP